MNSSGKISPIVAFINDLIFSSRLEDAAQRLGMATILIQDSRKFYSSDQVVDAIQFAEHTYGPGAILVDNISNWSPVMIIFDLNNQSIPWREWISLIKSAPATRRSPIVCFGAHKDIDSLKSAKDAGADVVFSRSRFVQDLPNILIKYARRLDNAEIETSCQSALSSIALLGLELFNQGAYFEAHEKLEEAWKEDQSPGRELYQAILQVAVAYLQIQRRNYTGAVKMFLRVRQWIRPLPDECRGVNIERLRQDAQAAYLHLLDLGRERINEFDEAVLCPVIYQ